MKKLMISDFHCSILVRTNRSLSDITKELKVEPTGVRIKGEKLSNFIGPAKTNVWKFEHVYRDYISVDESLNSFFSEYSDLCENIKKCSYKDEMCMRLYIQSDYAEICNAISVETLRRISSLGITVEFSIFSWGKVYPIPRRFMNFRGHKKPRVCYRSESFL